MTLLSSGQTPGAHFGLGLVKEDHAGRAASTTAMLWCIPLLWVKTTFKQLLSTPDGLRLTSETLGSHAFLRKEHPLDGQKNLVIIFPGNGDRDFNSFIVSLHAVPVVE